MDTSGVTQRYPTSRASWRSWLTTNHGSVQGVLLVVDTKASGSQRLSLDDAVQEALCFGWIDSKLRPLDDRRFAVLFTPRRRRGTWSQPNKARVQSLIAQGLMTDAGLRAVTAAWPDGSWSVLDEVDELRVQRTSRRLLPTTRRHNTTSSVSPSRR